MRRLEIPLFGLFFAGWAGTLLAQVGFVELAGMLELSLYALYSTAAAAGWIFGNVYLARSRQVGEALRGRLRLLYLLGPPGLIYLLRAMAPTAEQRIAPLVPLYALGVYAVLFLVPVALKHAVPRRD